MKTIIENVIKTGRYELKDMLTKLDTAWYQGQITYDERNELTDLARENATPDMGYANIENRITRVEDRIAALEAKGTTAGDAAEYPEFVVGKWYYNGDKCSFGGKNYTCTAPTGTVCAWSPTDYPAYWEEV